MKDIDLINEELAQPANEEFFEAGHDESTIINNNVLYRGANIDLPTKANIANKGQQSIITKWTSDDRLNDLAICLKRGGMQLGNIKQFLMDMCLCQNGNAPTKGELDLKIDRILDQVKEPKKSLTQEVRDLICQHTGNISPTFASQCLQLPTLADKKKVQTIFLRLEKEGLLERTGKVAGEYRIVNADLDEMDFVNASTATVDIILPFNIHQFSETMPGNIIVVAGESNAGKTAFLLNAVKDNMAKFEIYYFSSEMSAGEMKKRLLLFEDISLSDWNFKSYERSSNFADVIKPGLRKINIIDFLEIHENFYEVGGMIAKIHNKLKGAVAVIALQKNKGVDEGLGGGRSLEKPRLYLAMSPGKLKMVKVKNRKGKNNPNGWEIPFKLVNGCKFIAQAGWQ